MSTELSELNLKDDYERVLTLPEAKRWALEKPASLEVWATLAPVSAPEEKFQALLHWSQYPGEPPSLKFRDPATGRLDVTSAWPRIRGFRPTSFDACVNYCAEGFGLHPQWRSDPKLRWTPHGNVLLKVLRILQDEFDNHYEGRHP